jgi:hypothetical protein
MPRYAHRKPEADLVERSADTLPRADGFVGQEPIEGRLTVVDLSESSCRWPSGNPRDSRLSAIAEGPGAYDRASRSFEVIDRAKAEQLVVRLDGL